MLRIGLLGANSSIATELIPRLVNVAELKIDCYTRTGNLVSPLRHPNLSANCYSRFSLNHHDVIINLVGIGDPAVQKARPLDIIRVNDFADKLCLDYLKTSPTTAYIYLSSGIVRAAEEVPELGKLEHLRAYIQSKRDSENRHKEWAGGLILDLRLYNICTQRKFKSSSLISDAIESIKKKTLLTVTHTDIVRDYIHPEDLVSLMLTFAKHGTGYNCWDAYSLRPVTKFQILNALVCDYGLMYEIDHGSSHQGEKNIYLPRYDGQAGIGLYHPTYTSIEAVMSFTAEQIKNEA